MIEITKKIKLERINRQVGDKLELGSKEAEEIVIRKGFAKQYEKPSLTANEVVELIEKCESEEDLKKYESDSRQIVTRAYNKKLTELKDK